MHEPILIGPSAKLRFHHGAHHQTAPTRSCIIMLQASNPCCFTSFGSQTHVVTLCDTFASLIECNQGTWEQTRAKVKKWKIAQNGNKQKGPQHHWNHPCFTKSMITAKQSGKRRIADQTQATLVQQVHTFVIFWVQSKSDFSTLKLKPNYYITFPINRVPWSLHLPSFQARKTYWDYSPPPSKIELSCLNFEAFQYNLNTQTPSPNIPEANWNLRTIWNNLTWFAGIHQNHQ